MDHRPWLSQSNRSCRSDDVAEGSKGWAKASKTSQNSEPLLSTESQDLLSCASCSGSVSMKQASKGCRVVFCKDVFSWGRCAWSKSPGRFPGQDHLSTSFPGWQCSLLGFGGREACAPLLTSSGGPGSHEDIYPAAQHQRLSQGTGGHATIKCSRRGGGMSLHHAWGKGQEAVEAIHFFTGPPASAFFLPASWSPT